MSIPERDDFITGIDYLATISCRVFLYPFYGRPRYKIFCYHLICFLVCVASIQQLISLCLGLKSFVDIIVIAPNIGVSVMSLTKYMKVHQNKELYSLIFEHFRTDMWDVVIENSSESRKILKRYLKVLRYVTLWFVYYVIPLISVVVSFPLLIMYYDNKVLGKELEYRHPIEAWYPFDKVKWYYAAYTWESFIAALVVCIYTFSDLINVSYIAYICLELRLLGTHLERLFGEEEIKGLKIRPNATCIHNRIRCKLRTIILRYNFIASIASDLNLILGDLMLVNYTFGSVFICLTAFTVTVVDELYSTLRCFFFFVSLIISILNQCIMGQIISDHSEQLVEALYSSNWIYGDLQTRRMVLMFIMRLQKPFQLTAKGFVAMNLDTFTMDLVKIVMNYSESSELLPNSL